MSANRTLPAYPVVDGRCRHCGRAKPTWTPAAILAALRAAYATKGRAPYRTEWTKATPGHPAHTTVFEVFGSWKNALEAAGLPVPIRSNTVRVWTRDEVIHAIFDWRYHRGRLPRSHEWSAQTETTPSEKQVRRLFGTWNAALEAAGYTPTRRGPRATVSRLPDRVEVEPLEEAA